MKPTWGNLLEYSKKLALAIWKNKKLPDHTQVPLTPEKIQQTVQKIREQQESDRIFLEGINAEEEWNTLYIKIKKPADFRKYISFAAIVMVLIGVTTLYVYKIKRNTPVQITEQITSGSTKATLILEDGSKVALTNATYTNANANTNKEGLIYNKKDGSSEVAYNSLMVPRGGQFFVELADGTKVWLNSASLLKYPVKFTPGKSREVKLVYGEAYFEVSNSTAHHGDKFQVLTQNQTVEVLGTEFNIRAYPEEETMYTTLKKGSIAISNDFDHKLMKPGEQAVLQNDAFTVTPVDVDYATAWKNGYFMFKNTSLKNMMTELSRWYDMTVVFKNAEKAAYHFSGELKRGDDIQKLLKQIAQTNEVQFEIKGKTIMIH
ncbi:FecR family protein [Zhouia sp. PK063]|uniref:FecR family protein n=1 Tax=Zhouia sp. PK063 TaxID=3373602 RepID=UPI00378B1750